MTSLSNAEANGVNKVVIETAATYSDFTKKNTARMLSGLLSSNAKTTKRRLDVTSPCLFTTFTQRHYQQTSPPADEKHELNYSSSSSPNFGVGTLPPSPELEGKLVVKFKFQQ